jgi:triacylglycerol esterase/lipase EstA (alpha/beta hydrolase family)
MAPVVILPGYLAGASEYEPLRQELEARGYAARVVPLQVRSWFPTLGGRPVTPILWALRETIQKTCAEFGVDRVNLVAHSAGGWIARIYLGSVPYGGQVWQGREQVAALISLGSPHTSRERWTKRNLDFVNTHYPGAFWPEVKYVCVAGRVIQGQSVESGIPVATGALSGLAGLQQLLAHGWTGGIVGRWHYPHRGCPPAGGC